MGIFKKFSLGLKKTRESMAGAIENMLHSYKDIDEELYEDLEEILVMGDVGVVTASEIVEKLRERVKEKNIGTPARVKEQIKDIVAEMLKGEEEMSLITMPSVILVIGVNGVGKTTTIGKWRQCIKHRAKKLSSALRIHSELLLLNSLKFGQTEPVLI